MTESSAACCFYSELLYWSCCCLLTELTRQHTVTDSCTICCWPALLLAFVCLLGGKKPPGQQRLVCVGPSGPELNGKQPDTAVCIKEHLLSCVHDKHTGICIHGVSRFLRWGRYGWRVFPGLPFGLSAENKSLWRFKRLWNVHVFFKTPLFWFILKLKANVGGYRGTPTRSRDFASAALAVLTQHRFIWPLLIRRYL